MFTSATTQTPAKPVSRRRARFVRLLGSFMALVGIALLAWTFVVWRWNDPFTSLYTRLEQRKLDQRYAEIVAEERTRPIGRAPVAHRESVAELEHAVARSARAFRARAREGMPIGRIVVPRLGLDMIMVNGTDAGTLKKGPGRHLSTFMPGEGQLVYIAGHRTTYLAPFARIDRLKPGDRVTLEMPYATVVYSVTGHRIVDDQDLSVLESHGREEVALQACHPRFFATQRYIVWGRPVKVIPFDHRAFRPTSASRAAVGG